MLGMKCLPPELTDRIIDFHHKDPKALRVCSLVCRNWLPASRFHLFGIVSLKKNNVRRAVELLVAPSSTIAKYVHTLHISQYCIDTTSVFDIIVPHLGNFVAIKLINMWGQRWVYGANHGEIQAPRGLGTIGYLTIICDFAFNQFQLIFELKGRGISFERCLGVFRSVLDGRDASLWLPAIVQLPVYKQVDFVNIKDGHLPTVQDTLKLGGWSIFSTLLKFNRPRRPIFTSDFLDLTHNTSLYELCVRDLDLNIVNGSLCEMIQQIPSHMAYIQLSLRAYGCTGWNWQDIRKVADEFNHPRFSKLERVCVDITGVVKHEADAWVREELPRLDKRNILTVKFS